MNAEKIKKLKEGLEKCDWMEEKDRKGLLEKWKLNSIQRISDGRITEQCEYFYRSMKL